jgi:hypothetical protein
MAKITPKQQQVLDLYLETGNKSETARKLGIPRENVRDTIKKLEARGLVPYLTSAKKPEHLQLHKTTVQYDEQGKPVREWRRLIPEAEQMQEFVSGLCDAVKGKAKVKTKAPSKTQNSVLGEISIYDAHIRMYAEKAETNDTDYNCDIAVKRMVESAEGLASRFNKPERMIVTFGGDILHTDTRSNTTEKSGNVLDVDTRFHRGIDYAIKACYDVVQIASKLAPVVDIVVVEGNHDWHSCVWLSRVLDAFYEACPNINVLRQPSSRKYLVYGNNLLVWTHGDGVRMNQWQAIISTEFAKEWGTTKFRHLKMGHIHHKKKNQPMRVVSETANGWEEQRGLLVEYLPALCSTDAWHSGAGFIGSMKGASGFEYDKKAGLITRYYQHITS